MKTISDWNDLKEYGFHVLTGEACGIGLRLLVELDPHAHAIYSHYLGNTLTREAELRWPTILAELIAALPHLRMVDGKNDYLLQQLKRRVAFMQEGATYGEMDESVTELLTQQRIGGVMNGPSQYSQTDDQRRGLWCSVMLPHDAWLNLATYCLLNEGWDVVVAYTTVKGESYHQYACVAGMSHNEFEAEHERRAKREEQGLYVRPWRWYSRSNQPGNGLRNTHAFSGITEN